MASFTFGKRVERVIWRNNFIFWLPLTALVAGTVLYMQPRHSAAWWPPDSVSVVTAVITLVLLLAMRFYSINKTLTVFRSFVLRIENNLITREQKGLPERSIYINEITSIIRYKSGDILIKSKYPDQTIGISRYIENSGELEKYLSEMMPIEQDVTPGIMLRYRWIFTFAGIGAMGCVYLSDNRWLVGGSAIALLIYYSWALVVLWRNKSVDKAVKRRSLFLIFILFVILFIAAGKIWDIPNILAWLLPDRFRK